MDSLRAAVFVIVRFCWSVIAIDIQRCTVFDGGIGDGQANPFKK